MIFRDRTSAAEAPSETEEWAAQAFARRCFGAWTAADESELGQRLEKDPACADAFRRVEQSWSAVGRHATSAEIMRSREQAISRARRASARRWMRSGEGAGRPALRIAAGIAALGIALAAAYQLVPFGVWPDEYRTNIGERRSIELADHTRISLDADTRLRVRYSKESRVVELLQGQAQFGVAREPGRPFKVEAGAHTVVALGTVFTVEYVDRKMYVATLEGRVAVLTSKDQAPDELVAGEALRVNKEGQTAVIPKADLEVVTAWREGKVIFHAEPLGEAIRRLNRYSRLQLRVDDPELGALKITGLFDAGDTTTFVEALQSYLPVTADYSDRDVIRLKAR